MTSNSEFFKAAHKIARETRNTFDTYRMAFSAALKELYAMEKKSNEKTTEERLREAGFTPWTRRGNCRYYINSWQLDKVFDVTVRTGKYGDKVYVDGTFGLTKVADVTRDCAIYYDACEEKWMHGANELDSRVVDCIRI